MRIYKKAVLPEGFYANGIACGIKKSGKPDLGLIYSLYPAKAACLFTSNSMPAAPILLAKKSLKKTSDFRAIIVNSGNANCFTGDSGIKDAKNSASALARLLKIKEESVLVSSTGIIGRRLPVFKIKKAMPLLVGGLSHKAIGGFNKSILTTDTFTKEITVKFNLGKKVVTLCGVAKGAGMISPNMATMLVFILTDANISAALLKKALKIAVSTSFNCITVDGCMSTNDSVILLANGASGNPAIGASKGFYLFVKALNTVSLELAKMVVKDGEGATKFIRINVSRAASFKEAKAVALSIANSNLFKTAMYGQNPNFGRIVASAGASGIPVKEKDLRIKVSPINKKNIDVDVSINRGNYSATVYTSDLTPEYIKINAGYN